MARDGRGNHSRCNGVSIQIEVAMDEKAVETGNDMAKTKFMIGPCESTFDRFYVDQIPLPLFLCQS